MKMSNYAKIASLLKIIICVSHVTHLIQTFQQPMNKP